MMLEEMQDRAAAEIAIGKAMKAEAMKPRKEGGMGQKRKLPKTPTDMMDKDVLHRRMCIVETLKANPAGILSESLRQLHKDMNSGDVGWLRARGYLHTVRRPSKRAQVSEVLFYPGPKPEVAG